MSSFGSLWSFWIRKGYSSLGLIWALWTRYSDHNYSLSISVSQSVQVCDFQSLKCYFAISVQEDYATKRMRKPDNHREWNLTNGTLIHSHYTSTRYPRWPCLSSNSGWECTQEGIKKRDHLSLHNSAVCTRIFLSRKTERGKKNSNLLQKTFTNEFFWVNRFLF